MGEMLPNWKKKKARGFIIKNCQVQKNHKGTGTQAKIALEGIHHFQISLVANFLISKVIKTIIQMK